MGLGNGKRKPEVTYGSKTEFQEKHIQIRLPALGFLHNAEANKRQSNACLKDKFPANAGPLLFTCFFLNTF